MSVNLHITDRATGISEMHIVCGANEARERWMPVFKEFDLPMLEHAFAAGIQLEQENQSQFRTELRTAILAIESRYAFEDDVANIVYRTRRLNDLIDSHSIASFDLYLG